MIPLTLCFSSNPTPANPARRNISKEAAAQHSGPNPQHSRVSLCRGKNTYLHSQEETLISHKYTRPVYRRKYFSKSAKLLEALCKSLLCCGSTSSLGRRKLSSLVPNTHSQHTQLPGSIIHLADQHEEQDFWTVPESHPEPIIFGISHDKVKIKKSKILSFQIFFTAFSLEISSNTP